MIKQIRLIDWKSFADATLFIDPLTILIGTNASGKSNTLDALAFLQRIGSGISLFPAINGDVNLPALRGGKEWICRKPATRFALEVVADVPGEKSAEYFYRIEVSVNGTKAEVYDERLCWREQRPRAGDTRERDLFTTKLNEAEALGIAAYFSTGNKGGGRRIDLQKSHSILSQLETQNLRMEILDAAKTLRTAFQNIFVFDPIPSHMRNYSPLAETLVADGSNVAGVLAGMEPAGKEKLESIITTYLRSLPERDIIRVWAEKMGKFGSDAMIYCQEGWHGEGTHEIDARGMSDGTLRFLAIVTALLTRKAGSLLVIEEVDNGLHPSRAKVLVDMLKTLAKERGIDVLATTHNPALLDAAGPRMVPFILVAHRDGQSGYSHLTPLENLDQLPKLMASGSLGDLNSQGLIEKALLMESSK